MTTQAQPFQTGDVVHMNLLPPGIADVTVTGTGVCDDDDGCTEPTVRFNDPATGEPDEGHASDFTLIRRPA